MSALTHMDRTFHLSVIWADTLKSITRREEVQKAGSIISEEEEKSNLGVPDSGNQCLEKVKTVQFEEKTRVSHTTGVGKFTTHPPWRNNDIFLKNGGFENIFQQFNFKDISAFFF